MGVLKPFGGNGAKDIDAGCDWIFLIFFGFGFISHASNGYRKNPGLFLLGTE